MSNKKSKKFIIDNRKYQFDSQSFRIYVKQCAGNRGVRLVRIFEEISEAANVSTEAVKQWYYANNGPSDLNMIYEAVQVLNVADHMKLMKLAEEDEKVGILKSAQMKSLNRVYDIIIEYLDDFCRTDGFTGGLWHEFTVEGCRNVEQKIYEYAEKLLHKVHLVIQKEYFYLRDIEVYSELLEYTENDLYDIFDGKLSYGYRYEAIVEGNPTVADDYSKAFKKLSEIIEKYT